MRPDDFGELVSPLSFLLLEQALFDSSQDFSVGSLDSPVGFGMIDRGMDRVSPYGLVELLKVVAVKLPSIVHSELSWNSKSANDLLPEELLNHVEVMFVNALASTL